MTIRLLHFVYILCSLQIVFFTDADDSSNSIICGIPPCRAGCYYKETNVNSSQIGLCVIAPAGYYSPGDEMLYPCPKGTYASEHGSDICIVCPIGTSAPLEGSDACSPCDEGLYASVPGLVECNKCNPNKYFGSGSISIIRENGTDYCVDPKDAASECGNSTSPCSGRCYIAGNISNKEADFSMRFCSIVPKGYYSPHDDELLYECPVGMYSSEGSNECTLCSPGSAASLPGSGSCLPCPESTYVSTFGASTCLDCNSSLYYGLGSASTFHDEKSNISYCLKPSQQTFEYPSDEPTQYSSISPSLTPKSTSPLSQQPTRGTVEITIHPTSIFDVIAESTRSPQRQDDRGDTNSSSPNQVVFNDTSTRTDQSREIPTYLRFIIFFVVMLLMLISISYRWCYRRRPMCCRREQQQSHGRHYNEQTTIIRTKTFARTPPVDVILPNTDSDDEGMPSSPTFPVPKIISTTKIIPKKSSIIDEDEESEIGVYIEDGSVM